MPAYKNLEEKYLLHDFKINEKGGVEGKIGTHVVHADRSSEVILILGNTEGTGRPWVANLLPGGFFFSAAEGKKGMACPVFMMEDKPYFKKDALVDEKLFARAIPNKEPSPFLSFEEVKKAFELCEKGKLELAEYGNDKLSKKRFKALREIVGYKVEIEEAAKVFLQTDRIKEEVLKLKNEKEERIDLDKALAGRKPR
jgi:hypothetical protein